MSPAYPNRAALSILMLLVLGNCRNATGWADDSSPLRIRENWSAVFGGEQAIFNARIRTSKRFSGRLDWRLSIGGRTVKSGGVALATDSVPFLMETVIRVDVPPVMDEIVQQALLTVAATPAGESESLATLERTIWIFPRNPFARRAEWTEALGITLFDPNDALADRLEELGVPFERSFNDAALADIENGLVVIGPGVSFGVYRSLPETLLSLADRGIPVLCLAPSGGTIPIPQATDDLEQAPRKLELRRRDIVTELDKRLDATGWPPAGEMLASTVQLVAEGTSVVAEASAEPTGWPWLAVEFPSGGKLIVGGFDLAGHWDAGPNPRFLLLRIFESLANDDEDPSNPERSSR